MATPTISPAAVLTGLLPLVAWSVVGTAIAVDETNPSPTGDDADVGAARLRGELPRPARDRRRRHVLRLRDERRRRQHAGDPLHRPPHVGSGRRRHAGTGDVGLRRQDLGARRDRRRRLVHRLLHGGAAGHRPAMHRPRHRRRSGGSVHRRLQRTAGLSGGRRRIDRRQPLPCRRRLVVPLLEERRQLLRSRHVALRPAARRRRPVADRRAGPPARARRRVGGQPDRSAVHVEPRRPAVPLLFRQRLRLGGLCRRLRDL